MKCDPSLDAYDSVLTDVSTVIEAARTSVARSVNCIMTAVYWFIGRRIVEFEQEGEERADYGEEVLKRLSADLTGRFGRGFAKSNLYQMRAFYLSHVDIFQTVSGKSESVSLATIFGLLLTPSAELSWADLAHSFPLPWSAYVRLLSVKNELARKFYETEALRNGALGADFREGAR
jgi:hypothetical protein